MKALEGVVLALLICLGYTLSELKNTKGSLGYKYADILHNTLVSKID